MKCGILYSSSFGGGLTRRGSSTVLCVTTPVLLPFSMVVIYHWVDEKSQASHQTLSSAAICRVF